MSIRVYALILTTWYCDWQFWLSAVTVLVLIAQVVVACKLYSLERTIRKVDLAVALGRGAYDKDGNQVHDQDWIDVTNGSQTGIRVTSITVRAARADGLSHQTSKSENSVVAPFSVRKINIYLLMRSVLKPICPEPQNPVPVKGRVTITLMYTAHGAAASTEPFEFDGEIFRGDFLAPT